MGYIIRQNVVPAEAKTLKFLGHRSKQAQQLPGSIRVAYLRATILLVNFIRLQ